MQFDIITIFPRFFDSYLKESFIKKAIAKGLIDIRIHNLRDFASDKRGSVDDRPFGGGLGMVIKIEPVFKAVSSLIKLKTQNSKLKITSQNLKLNKTKETKVILFTPRGRKFNQKIAYQLSKLDRIIMICGRYEGVDERVAKHIADLKLSIGDYDLMGGEIPAMVVTESVSRLIPGVLGKPELLKERIPSRRGRGGRGFIEYAQYTRPEIFAVPAEVRRAKVGTKKGTKWRVPKVLLSGDHKKIEEWRKKHQKLIE